MKFHGNAEIDKAKFMNYDLDEEIIALVCWGLRNKSYKGETMEER